MLNTQRPALEPARRGRQPLGVPETHGSVGWGERTPLALAPSQGGASRSREDQRAVGGGLCSHRGAGRPRSPREDVTACWDNSTGWRGGAPRRLRAGVLGGAYGDSRDTHGQALGLGDVTPTSLGHMTVGKLFQ